MLEILMRWAVTLSGGVFMAQIIWLAYQSAHSPAIVGTRRKLLLGGSLFLAICTLLAMIGICYVGPIRSGTTLVALVFNGFIIWLGYTILSAWTQNWLSHHR